MKVHCFEGSSGAWSWQLADGRGTVIATSVNNYESRAACSKSLNTLQAAMGENLKEITFEPLVADEEVKADDAT